MRHVRHQVHRHRFHDGSAGRGRRLVLQKPVIGCNRNQIDGQQRPTRPVVCEPPVRDKSELDIRVVVIGIEVGELRKIAVEVKFHRPTGP